MDGHHPRDRAFPRRTRVPHCFAAGSGQRNAGITGIRRGKKIITRGPRGPRREQRRPAGTWRGETSSQCQMGHGWRPMGRCPVTRGAEVALPHHGSQLCLWKCISAGTLFPCVELSTAHNKYCFQQQ